MKIARIDVVVLMAIWFSSCVKAKKNVNEYFPAVKTVVAFSSENGDVIVKGEVELGGDSVYAVGFCADVSPEPDISKNQRYFATPSVNSFSTQYFNLDTKLSFNSFNEYDTYYFRAWAANKYGYIYGNTIAIRDIRQLAVAVPCNLTSNFIDPGLGNGATPVVNTFNSQKYSSIRVLSATFKNEKGVPSLGFEFNTLTGQPAARTYTITEKEPYLGECRVKLSGPGFEESNAYYIHAGGFVYVKNKSKDSVEVALCDGAWNKPNESTVYFLKAKFVVK